MVKSLKAVSVVAAKVKMKILQLMMELCSRFKAVVRRS